MKPVPVLEGPVLPEPPELASAITSRPSSVLKPRPVLVLEEAKRKPDVIQLQALLFKLSKDYFAKDDEDSSKDEDKEAEAFEFFKGLFEKDKKLKECYQKHWENGEFCCLVCIAIGVKVSKRYKDCVALFQHAVTVLKTKKKGAHLGFGRAICGLLGWNFERLPSIVLAVGECSKNEVEKSYHIEVATTLQMLGRFGSMQRWIRSYSISTYLKYLYYWTSGWNTYCST